MLDQISVRSKLQLFDHTKKPQRSRLLDHQKPGHVKAKLAIFDAKLTSNSKKMGHNINNIDHIKPSSDVHNTECHSNRNQSLHSLIEKQLKPTEESSSDSTETLNA